MDSTVDAPSSIGKRHSAGHRALPGLLVLVDNGRPRSHAMPVESTELVIGRGNPGSCFVEDEWVSRSHVRVQRVENCWRFEDLKSRNGSWLNGQALVDATTVQGPALLRLGRSLCWAVEDLTPYLSEPVHDPGDGPILGGAMRRIWREIRLAARASDTLLIGGPSGAGKELAARGFHQASFGEVPGATDGAPFVPVNCATIPHGLAERLLFGAKRGTYSGASQDAVGLIETANGGTLFLDELAELDPLVQAKLLRVLETHEITPLGATQARAVELRVCAASLRDLRGEVEAGRFRKDLYYRLGRPSVQIPRLSERLDELPLLIVRTLRAVDRNLRPSPQLFEQCALRPWPGNVRELIGELRHASFAAVEAGAGLVEPEFLPVEAGRALSQPTTTSAEVEYAPTPRRRRESTQWPDDETIRAALGLQDGNVSATARNLGLHRNQLRRWLEKN